MEGGGRESPRRARYFSLLRQRKVPKRKATPSLRPLRCAKGQTCGGAAVGCAVELALRCARRSDIHGESVDEAWALRRPCSPRNRPAAGAASRGGQPNIQTTEQPDIHSGHRFARPRLRSARRLRPRSGAERSDGPCGCSVPRAPLDVPSTAGCPVAPAQGTQTVGSPFFWVLFFGEAKKSTSPAGRLPASALHQGMPLIRQTALCTEGECFKKHSCQRISH